VASTVVIQPKQGIGDVIWHLPFIRAIAAVSPGGTVTFLTLPSTHAQELLQAEPCIDATFYFENRGSELSRGLNLVRLAALLRRLGGDTAWILDRSVRPALAAFAAGIPNRIGLGLGPQRWFITNPGIDQKLAHAGPIDWLTALMDAMNVPCANTRPDLKLPPTLLVSIGQRYETCPRPWIVLGLGASHPDKDWPDRHWAEFIGELRRRAHGTVFLIGGHRQMERAARMIAITKGSHAVSACDLEVIEAAALLRQADLFVGPDSGPLNLAVAAGTETLGLFGSTRVLSHAQFVHVILPDDGRSPTPDGMQRISPCRVLARVEQYLACRQ
jgi:heptosyltransferase II